MRVAFIIQRYGNEVVGGAELHCRWVVERLAKKISLEVITTTAIEYLTWHNDYPAGLTQVNGVQVRRFTVERRREEERFQRLSNKVCFHRHSDAEEREWVEEHGPYSPQLISYLRDHHQDYDCLVFFCYRYWVTYHGLSVAPHKSLLIPTAEHDRAIHLRLFKEFFSIPARILYNSPEEKSLINEISERPPAPGPVVGVGINVPKNLEPEKLAIRLDILGDYIIYVGRIEREKGCLQLIDYFLRFISGRPTLNLVMVGKSALQIKEHVNIIPMGVLTEVEKFAALGAAKALIMPSPYESLSMVLLEAWAMKRPALVNGNCDVLRCQCIRSNGGLWYRSYEEFAEALSLLLDDQECNRRLGALGYRYYQQNYEWDIVTAKYERVFAEVLPASAEPQG